MELQDAKVLITAASEELSARRLVQRGDEPSDRRLIGTHGQPSRRVRMPGDATPRLPGRAATVRRAATS